MAGQLVPWELLDTRMILERQPWLALYQDIIRLPSGRCLEDFYRVVLPDYVLIAAFTPEGQLVMVRGYKHGLGRISLFAPAGHLEPGEDPLEGAQRELFEETGYTAPTWQLLSRSLTDGNRHCGMAYLFLARGAVLSAASRPPDDAEELEVELINPADLLQRIRQEEIALLPTVAAMALAVLALGEGA
jgi:ADP-ribose pyrophosphatase